MTEEHQTRVAKVVTIIGTLGRELRAGCAGGSRGGGEKPPVGLLARIAPGLLRPTTLGRELAPRFRGYATAIDELEPGLWAVAAPLHGASGVVAALSISGPTIRLPDGLLDELGRLLIAEAAPVSARLR
jgi:Bacterial transcriptional regulator